jgi:hypothetical protein
MYWAGCAFCLWLLGLFPSAWAPFSFNWLWGDILKKTSYKGIKGVFGWAFVVAFLAYKP